MVLLAKDIVEKDFLSLPRGTSALEAAKQMKSSQLGFVIIVGADGHPEGIVTEWDYLSKLVAEGKDPLKTKLEDIMSTGTSVPGRHSGRSGGATRSRGHPVDHHAPKYKARKGPPV